VSRIDQLEFLSDIIPRTMTYKKAVQRKEKALLAPDSPEHVNGSPVSDRKRSKGAGRQRRGSGQGGGTIERYFGGRKSGNGVGVVSDDEGDVDDGDGDDGYGEDRMDVDG
jgi:hypothetical protein